MAQTRGHDHNNDPGPRGRHNEGAWPLNGFRRGGTGFSSPAEKVPPANAMADTNLIEARVISETHHRSPGQGALYAHGSVLPDAIPAEFYEVPIDAETDRDLAGLAFEPTGPRRPVRDLQWAATFRRFGRFAAWFLPAGVIALAVASIWGWPTPANEPTGASPGTWLVVTLAGLGLWLFGVIGMTALFAATPGRPWSVAAMVSTLVAMVLLLPVVGVVGLARPAVTRTARSIGGDAARDLEARFLDGSVARSLAFGGLVLLGVGVLALGLALLASEVMNRLDGWLMGAGVAVAAIAGFVSWDFLLALAAMVFLAATLGVAWTASRLTPDGHLRDF
jgi:hypothetical protein